MESRFFPGVVVLHPVLLFLVLMTIALALVPISLRPLVLGRLVLLTRGRNCGLVLRPRRFRLGCLRLRRFAFFGLGRFGLGRLRLRRFSLGCNGPWISLLRVAIACFCSPSLFIT